MLPTGFKLAIPTSSVPHTCLRLYGYWGRLIEAVRNKIIHIAKNRVTIQQNRRPMKAVRRSERRKGQKENEKLRLYKDATTSTVFKFFVMKIPHQTTKCIWLKHTSTGKKWGTWWRSG
jgi:hypothetical protein